ncbi:Metalloenzyme, LuxS/M16 peptidase-like protein [Gorgonomyces haynaldii]|nr:Metalloenzyme, LuxS/M16 peptidase-like protein [Gorgonomyces haynaldii]
MLFMGTQKYPIENDYGQFLSSHGGHSNAYTAGEHTNYYFDVDHSFLQEAMDRFAQFFISPLFLEDGTEREMNAVDSEHKKNLQSDPWRVHQLEKDLCDPKHPYSRFGTGSLETLRDIPQSQGLQVRKLLLDFHKRYYSANIMKCVVLGRDSLETLEQWATECFSRIENNNVPVPSFETHPLSQNQLQQEIWVKPVKQSRSLTVSFPFPDSRQHYKTRPASYISHLVGHESEGSLLSYLKTKGWAQNLSAGHASGGIGFAFFSIHVELTQLGLDKYHDVICAIFQYIKMIQRQGPLEWIYDECRSVARMNFRFQEKSSPASYCSRTASAMHDYPTPDILSGPHLMEVFDPETIQRLLDLMQPHNFRVIVQNPKFETEGWTRAKWYGTEYKVVPFSSEFKQQLDQIQEISQMHLPERNQFIPDSFDLLPIESDGAPQIVLESPLMRLWYKQDHLFKIPKAAIYLEIISPLAYQDVRSCVLTRLFTELLKDALNEFSYAAELAGLDYSLTNTPEGMVLTLNGFSNKIHLLADQFILKMKQAEFSELQFHRIKERLNKSYHNWFLESPASQATYFVTFLLQDTLYHAQRKIQVLEHLTLQDLNAFVPQLLSKMFIQGFVHGNLHKQKVREIGQKMIQDLQYQALEEDQRLADVRTHIINGAEHTFYHLVYNPNNVNSAIEFCLQIGPENDVQGRALLGLLAQISGEPVFDQLRTKEQLGYSVYGGIRKMRWHGYRIVIQSERDPIYLEERIELFLRQFQQTLLEMPDEKFNKYKQAYVNNLLEKPKNLNQHSNRLWNIISSRYYDFDRNETDASFVQSIQKQQLVQFYQHAIVGPERRKISVHMVSQKLKDTQRQGQELVDEDVQEQKKQWPLSEPPVPAKRVDQFVIN